MAEISVSALAMVDAPPDEVRAALADYRDVRPAILTSDFTDYQVLGGGRGSGSRVRWTLTTTLWGRWKRRARDWEVQVEEPDGELVERDTLSSTVTTWTVFPGPDGRSVVRVELSWDGPDGFSGIVARSRARTLRQAHGDVLLKLRNRFADPAGAATG